MKNFLCIIITLIFLFVLCACNGNEKDATTEMNVKNIRSDEDIAYDDGFYDGYEEGYNDASMDSYEMIEELSEDVCNLKDIEDKFIDEYDISCLEGTALYDVYSLGYMIGNRDALQGNANNSDEFIDNFYEHDEFEYIVLHYEDIYKEGYELGYSEVNRN